MFVEKNLEKTCTVDIDVLSLRRFKRKVVVFRYFEGFIDFYSYRNVSSVSIKNKKNLQKKSLE